MAQSQEGGFGAENLALDDPAVREMGNVKAALSGVPGHQMTEREKSRLQTLRRKASELEGIVRERKTEQNR